ncbi:MAG TPA: NUDIX domain-containing protein [Bacteroidia bacterium]|nr:NUDIX domain-containing protein [Bacteroidia bacterium]
MYKVFINDQEIVFKRPESGLKKLKINDDRATTIGEIVKLIHSNRNSLKKSVCIESSHPYLDFLNFRKHFRVIKAAGGIVHKKESPAEILLIFRLGNWDLPKGKIDKGEAVKTAALREVEEECGIQKLTINKQLSHTYHLYQIKSGWVIKQTSWFSMTCADKSVLKPQAEEGIEKAKWVSIKTLPRYLPLSYTSIADLIKKEVLGS